MNKYLTIAPVLFAITPGWAAPLPALQVAPDQVTVSGLSSGGFMAVQLHVAYSATFKKGAGVVAGGPYYCAEGSVLNATGRCMAHSSSIPVNNLVAATRNLADSGRIDPVANLADSKVYLFSGTRDSIVKTAVMDDLETYYRNFVPAGNIAYKKSIAAEHAFVTEDFGNSCSAKGTPYINDCDFDLAGAILGHLYGPLNARNEGELSGTFTEFDQSAFVSGHGLAATGWIFVPQPCAAGAPCRLHVALHGCQQNSADIGQQFVRRTGYNRWADSNHLIVLYPQTSPAATNSCWDWWGYDSSHYADKTGPQMAAVKAMVDRLASRGPVPTGLAASGATADSMVLGWNAVAGAAGYHVYRGGHRITVNPVSDTRYTDTGLAANTAYSWTVTALDASGRESAPSVAASGTTTGATPTCYTASNYAHVMAGRASSGWSGFTYAKGSDQSMGFIFFATTTLKQTGPEYYVIGTCPQ